MKLTIDPTGAVPVSEQIAESVRFAIASGDLTPGERLPSVRGLARDILVNPNTVAKVYRDLERDGILRTRPGSGVFVAKGSPRQCRRASLGAVKQAVQQAVAKGRAAGLGEEDIEAMWKSCLTKAGVACHDE